MLTKSCICVPEWCVYGPCNQLSHLLTNNQQIHGISVGGSRMHAWFSVLILNQSALINLWEQEVPFFDLGVKVSTTVSLSILITECHDDRALIFFGIPAAESYS